MQGALSIGGLYLLSVEASKVEKKKEDGRTEMKDEEEKIKIVLTSFSTQWTKRSKLQAGRVDVM
jgi:hypothetical protein